MKIITLRHSATRDAILWATIACIPLTPHIRISNKLNKLFILFVLKVTDLVKSGTISRTTRLNYCLLHILWLPFQRNYL
jgi:hypothetical protein